MPKPVYIICAQGAVEDKETNLVTLFQIVEAFAITIDSQDDGNAAQTQHGISTAVSVWMTEDGDEKYQFEHEFILKSDELEVSTGVRPFSFKSPAKLNRCKLDIGGFPPMKKSGILYITNRVRRTGETNWIASQEYPILVEVILKEHVTAGNQASPINSE